jgi:aminodeoxyfutalosine deaminase
VAGLARDAVTAAFLPEEEKRRLAAEIDAYLAATLG